MYSISRRSWLTLFSLVFLSSFFYLVTSIKLFSYGYMLLSGLIILLTLMGGVSKFIFGFPFSVASVLLIGSMLSTKSSELVSVYLMPFYFLTSYFIAYQLKNKRLQVNFSWITFILSHLYFLGFTLFSLISNGTINENTYNEIFVDNSRNIVSAILLFCTIFLLASTYIRNKKVYMSTLFIDLFCSLLLYGRSGIMLSFCVLIIGLVLSYKTSDNKQKLSNSIVTFFFAVTVVALLGKEIYIYLSDIIAKTNLQSGLDSPRFTMWQEYVSHMDLYHLIHGADFNYSPTIMDYEGNPHNTFIMLQSRVGFSAVLLYVFLTLLWCILLSKQPLLAILLLLIFIRMFFDVLGFFWFYDYIWMSLLFFMSSKYENYNGR